jgi:hypothetical protein
MDFLNNNCFDNDNSEEHTNMINMECFNTFLRNQIQPMENILEGDHFQITKNNFQDIEMFSNDSSINTPFTPFNEMIDSYSSSPNSSYSVSSPLSEVSNSISISTNSNSLVDKENLNIFNKHIDYETCCQYNKPKLFKCNYLDCSKAYKSKENLTLHYRNIHLKEKPYNCLYCGAAFSHRNGKTYHERKFHTKYLPYKCCKESKILNLIF